MYIADLDPDVLRTITQRKVVDYLRRRRGPAIAQRQYVIEVQEGRSVEIVTPQRPDGVRVSLLPQRTLWGTIEFNLFVAADAAPRRVVSVVGGAGTTILDSIIELEEFSQEPWSSGQVAGEVTFPGLQQTAGRRAILRDREAFPVFLSAVQGAEPKVQRQLERINAEVDRRTEDRLQQTIRKVLGTVLKELDDLDNPMRAALGHEPGDGALFSPLSGNGQTASGPVDQLPSLAELSPSPQTPPSSPNVETSASPDRSRSSRLPTIAPDPEPGEHRSRFDPEDGIVYYNSTHSDYLLEADEARLLDYLATLVSKEYVVYNNPKAAPVDLAEELVRMLVRVRQHLPKRR